MLEDDAEKYERVADEDSPERCQARTAHAQCMIKKTPGSDYCHQHGGHNAISRQKKEDMHNLQLTQFKARCIQLGHNPNILSLRDEIGVSRIVLETILNKCEGPVGLITFMPQIAKQTEVIAKLVRDCQYVEQKIGHLLDKGTLMQFAGKVIDIITEQVTDVETKKIIAFQIVAAAEELQNE